MNDFSVCQSVLFMNQHALLADDRKNDNDPSDHNDDDIVRFLLEGSEGTVLYTGDFRLSRQDFIDFEHLKSGIKSV